MLLSLSNLNTRVNETFGQWSVLRPAMNENNLLLILDDTRLISLLKQIMRRVLCRHVHAVEKERIFLQSVFIVIELSEP